MIAALRRIWLLWRERRLNTQTVALNRRADALKRRMAELMVVNGSVRK